MANFLQSNLTHIGAYFLPNSRCVVDYFVVCIIIKNFVFLLFIFEYLPIYLSRIYHILNRIVLNFFISQEAFFIQIKLSTCLQLNYARQNFVYFWVKNCTNPWQFAVANTIVIEIDKRNIQFSISLFFHFHYFCLTGIVFYSD